MKKLLTTTALAVSLCAGATFPASAETVVGTVKFWQYMQADGWKSADGMDNDTLNNTLYQASVIGNYPRPCNSCCVSVVVVLIFSPTRKHIPCAS